VFIWPLLSIGYLLSCDWPAPELMWAGSHKRLLLNNCRVINIKYRMLKIHSQEKYFPETEAKYIKIRIAYNNDPRISG
jgi:hypothetical protein